MAKRQNISGLVLTGRVKLFIRDHSVIRMKLWNLNWTSCEFRWSKLPKLEFHRTHHCRHSLKMHGQPTTFSLSWSCRQMYHSCNLKPLRTIHGNSSRINNLLTWIWKGMGDSTCLVMWLITTTSGTLTIEIGFILNGFHPLWYSWLPIILPPFRFWIEDVMWQQPKPECVDAWLIVGKTDDLCSAVSRTNRMELAK